MAVERQNIVRNSGFIFVILLVVMLIIALRVAFIQINEGERYRAESDNIAEKIDTIHANKGNVYAADGSLLATSMFRYEIRMDVKSESINRDTIQKYLPALSDSLSVLLGEPASFYRNRIGKAIGVNGYLLIARNLDYTEYSRMRKFPIFRRGLYAGGFISKQRTVREHPLGKVAARTIGYDDYRGRPGIEGAFSKELRGKDGQRLKQKIAQGQWKPINDDNEVEPQNGKDIITTIDVNMQDIAHQALLEQLKYHKAEHGSVVLMEVKTGEIKAIANLGLTKSGKYYERRNYAVGESHEPGSAFKLMSLVAALEDNKIDTTTIWWKIRMVKVMERFLQHEH